MPWGFGWGWRGGWGPYPGRGPWSFLPPWMRPGWVFGRGWCWYYFGVPGWALWLRYYYYPYAWRYMWYPSSWFPPVPWW